MRRIVVTTILISIQASCARTVYAPPYHFAVAGSREFVPAGLVEGARTERTLSRAATGDTSEHESLTQRIEERPVDDPGGPAIWRVTNGHYAGGDYYDSLLVRRADLTPIREHLAYAQRRIDKRFEYHGTSVHQVNVIGDSTREINSEYTIPVYAFSEIETIVQSLPFHPFYSAILPLYSEGDDALEMDSVYVENDHPGERWTVRFADPAIVAIYGIDAKTRRILDYNVTNRRTKARARKIYEPVPPQPR